MVVDATISDQRVAPTGLGAAASVGRSRDPGLLTIADLGVLARAPVAVNDGVRGRDHADYYGCPAMGT